MRALPILFLILALVAESAKPTLGIAMKTSERDILAPGKHHPFLGVKVHQVIPGSPASKTEIAAGHFIMAIEGAPVCLVADVAKTIAAHEVGDVLSLQMYVAPSDAEPEREYGVSITLGEAQVPLATYWYEARELATRLRALARAREGNLLSKVTPALAIDRDFSFVADDPDATSVFAVIAAMLDVDSFAGQDAFVARASEWADGSPAIATGIALLHEKNGDRTAAMAMVDKYLRDRQYALPFAERRQLLDHDLLDSDAGIDLDGSLPAGTEPTRARADIPSRRRLIADLVDHLKAVPPPNTPSLELLASANTFLPTQLDTALAAMADSGHFPECYQALLTRLQTLHFGQLRYLHTIARVLDGIGRSQEADHIRTQQIRPRLKPGAASHDAFRK